MEQDDPVLAGVARFTIGAWGVAFFLALIIGGFAIHWIAGVVALWVAVTAAAFAWSS